MKKLDKLILKAFIGPLIITFLVSVFVLVIQYMLNYFDDFVGKDLGMNVFAKLLFYFSINMSPIALPLAILISSLMTYGKLGEHFELTAIKSAGISLIRTLYPTFALVVLISIGAYFLANYLVPRANLRAYSLLYDIKHKKPSVDIREGQFYTGIPKMSIKVNEKFDEGEGLKDIVIYDHKNQSGNKKVILADSGRMYTILDDRYLVLELYYGNHYIEKKKKKRDRKDKIENFTRTDFESMKIVFSLASFGLNETDMDLFAGNRKMKTSHELTMSMDSMNLKYADTKIALFKSIPSFYRNHLQERVTVSQSLQNIKDKLQAEKSLRDSLKLQKKYEVDSLKKLQEATLLQDSLEVDTVFKPSITIKDSLGQDTVLAAKISTRDSLKVMKIPSSTNKKVSKKKLIKKTIAKKKSAKKTPVRNGSFALPKLVDAPEKLAKNTQSLDTLYLVDSLEIALLHQKIDTFFNMRGVKYTYIKKATAKARSIKSKFNASNTRATGIIYEIGAHAIEKHKKIAIAFSCMVLFLIGAPLGAIIKKGGLGVPIIVAVMFFIVFYVMLIISEKWAKAGTIDPLLAAWISNLVLLPFGVFFLRQARLDARVFDPDIYLIWIDAIKSWWKKRNKS